MAFPETEVGQELYTPDKKQITSVRTAIRRGGLTCICCFLSCVAFSVRPVMAEDTTTVPYKDWWEYTDEEKNFLQDRWTDEKTEAVVIALKEGKPLPVFVVTLSHKVWGDAFNCADLRQINLREDSLPKVGLEYACMQGADLHYANLQGADLIEADLQGAYLFSANLQGTDLYGADLQGAVLQFANLQGADLSDANSQGAHLFGADLQGAALFEADLQGAQLTGANLHRANLWEANLQGADLSYANMQGANLAGAIFENTLLYRPKLNSTVGYRDIEWRNCYVGDDLLTYRQLKSLYRNAEMDELVTEFHYWENWVKTRQGSFPNYIVRLFFLELTYGYGSRPWWLLRYSLAVIGLFSIIFYVPALFPRANLGIYTSKPGSARKRRLTWRQPHECLYFSLLAFVTIGYGAIKPRQWLQLFRLKLVEHEPVGWIRIFVGVEAALGIWVLALLVTVLFGR